MNNRLYYALKAVQQAKGWAILAVPFIFVRVFLSEPSLWAKHARRIQRKLNIEHNTNY